MVLSQLCIVLYITVIICICTVPMARSHLLVVPENPLEIPNHAPVFGKASDLVGRPNEWVNRWSYPHRGAQSPVITNAPVHGWGTHWYLVL